MILKSWVCTGKWGTAGIPFEKYESVILKLCHAFISILAGVGLLSPCNRVFQAQPSYVYLHKNKRVLHALQGCCTLLRESTREPTWFQELTSGWPDYVGVVDASCHGVRGVVFGKLSACTPTVFQWQWPDDFASIVGKCRYRDCHFRKEGGHPLPGDITDEFADQVINAIGKGVVPPSIQGGSPPKKQKGEGTQR